MIKQNESSQKSMFKKDFTIVEHAKLWFTISLSIILIGLIVFGIWGFNLGIDFTGGTVLDINVGDTLTSDTVKDQYKAEITNVLNDHGLDVSYYQTTGTGADTNISIRYQDINGKSEEEMAAISVEVANDITEQLSLDENAVEQSQRIGATASSELLINCLEAVLIAVILILIYIAIRFELSFGISAIVALFHDILIMCALVIIFRIQINSSFVAALITIVGYSINDTIVIFDRIRENKRKPSYKTKSNTEVANISIRDSLTRTVNTSLTTLFAILFLAIVGVTSIREFAIPIIFGLVAGTYSSIFIAAPLWAIVNDNTVKKSDLKNKKYTSKNNSEDYEVVIDTKDTNNTDEVPKEIIIND